MSRFIKLKFVPHHCMPGYGVIVFICFGVKELYSNNCVIVSGEITGEDVNQYG